MKQELKWEGEHEITNLKQQLIELENNGFTHINIEEVSIGAGDYILEITANDGNHMEDEIEIEPATIEDIVKQRQKVNEMYQNTNLLDSLNNK